MADANRGNRPLSPFMLGQHYRFQITSAMSILHRVTGVGLALGAVLVVWWFLAAASGPDAFDAADGFMTNWLVVIVLLVPSLIAFWYHTCNGIRHLMWDTGYGLTIPEVYKSAYVAIGATAVLTIITLIAAL